MAADTPMTTEGAAARICDDAAHPPIRPPNGSGMRLGRTIVTVTGVVAMAGCSVPFDATVGSSAGPTSTAPATAGTEAPTTAAPRNTASAPAATGNAELSAGWVDEASAKAALVTFAAALTSADIYRVDTSERVKLDGDEYFEERFEYVVDVADRRAQSTQTLAVSDENLWEQVVGEAEAELARWHKLQAVVDFAPDPPVTFITYGGPYGSHGEWLLLDMGNATPGFQADLVYRLDHSAIEDLTAPLLEVAALRPVGVNSALSQLEYQVPASLGTIWLPTNMRRSMDAADVDVSTLGPPGRATITPISGGIEAVVDLALLVQEATGLLADRDASESFPEPTTITMRIYGIGGGLRVSLPPAESIRTDHL